MKTRATIGTALLLLVGLAAASAAQERGFVKLFNGRDLEGFQFVGAPESTWKVQDGVIACTGSPNGYLATRGGYRQYVLRFDWRYLRPAGLQRDADFKGNGGLLVHIAGEHKVWPKCVEVQLQNADAGNIFALGGAQARGKKDVAVQSKAIKPVGEWNREEVICVDDKIVCLINGEVVCVATGADPVGGPIGWQSEGAPFELRNIEIKPLG